MKITNKMRFMLIMLSVVMALSLFACAETPEETTTKAPEATTEKPTETTEKTEPTEAPVDTDATDAPVVDETTDAEAAETTEAATESESASRAATTETTEAETTEAPCLHEDVTEIEAETASCEDDGNEAYAICVSCGAIFSADGEILAEIPVIEAIGHSWNEGEVIEEPGCEVETGVMHYVCKNDATHEDYEAIPPTGHAWDEGKVTTEPTCEGKGVKTYTCANDTTHTKTEEIPANGHPTPDESAWELDAENGLQNERAYCQACGGYVYRPATTTTQGLTFLSPEYLVETPKHRNIEDVTVLTDENGMKYYHATTTASGTEAYLVFSTGEEAMKGVGNYIALLIRKNTGPLSVQCWINYAGTLDHTNGDGTTNTSVNKTLPLKCNSEWELLIFDFTGAAQVSKENGIGWARFDIFDGAFSTVGTADIAFVAFFDSEEDIIEYYGSFVDSYQTECAHIPDGVEKPSKVEGKVAMTCLVCEEECNVSDCGHNNSADWKAGDSDGYRGGVCSLCGAEFNEKIKFTVNFDAKNCTLNGIENAVIAKSAKMEDKSIVIDASAFTLTSADGLAFGGWFVTPAGTAAYKYRIVSVDGTPVENAELLEYFAASGQAGTGITDVGLGRGWEKDSAMGAAFQKPNKLNLSAYAGKTVNVEIVAVTTYGANVVIAQINNIKVP